VTPERGQQIVATVTEVVVTLADRDATAEERERAVVDMVEATTTDGEIFCAFWTLSVASTTALKHALHVPPGEHIPLVLAQMNGDHGQIVDAAAAPPRVVLAGRWMTAAANDDLDTAIALFKSVPIAQALSDFGEDVIRLCSQMLLKAAAAIG
jgi:hypothetical protein